MFEDDTAKRLRDMVRSLDEAIASQVDPATLYDIEEALGTFPEPRPGVRLHGMQQVAAMHDVVEGSMRDTMDAISRAARLREEIVDAVMRDPRVVAAMAEATRRGTVDAAVPTALEAMQEELVRRGLRRE